MHPQNGKKKKREKKDAAKSQDPNYEMEVE